MNNAEMWLTPLLFLPGVALLIMSTSMRYGQVHSEMHELQSHEDKTEIFAGHLLRRSIYFRNALVSLYLAFGLFALASLLGGLTALWMETSKWLVTGLSCIGIANLIFTAYQLIRESMLSLEIIKQHCDHLQE